MCGVLCGRARFFEKGGGEREGKKAEKTREQRDGCSLYCIVGIVYMAWFFISRETVSSVLGIKQKILQELSASGVFA